MLGFFDEYDELYWNATGLEWAFPIDHATATVTFDFESDPEIIAIDGFTGAMGERGKAPSMRVGDSSAIFASDEILLPHEGLTVVVSWPKGFVVEPDGMQRLVGTFVVKECRRLLTLYRIYSGILIH